MEKLIEKNQNTNQNSIKVRKISLKIDKNLKKNNWPMKDLGQ